jgi:hypothetical protein
MTSMLGRPSRILYSLVASVVLLGASVADASAAPPVTTQTTLAASVAAPVTGHLVRLKSVVSEPPGIGLPTGSVTFSDSGTPIGTVALSTAR